MLGSCKHQWRLEDRTEMGESLALTFICNECGKIEMKAIGESESVIEPQSVRLPTGMWLVIIVLLVILLVVALVIVL